MRSLCASCGRCRERRKGSSSWTPTPAAGPTTCWRRRRGESRDREPEWPAGMRPALGPTDAPAPVQDLLDVVRAYDRYRGNLTPVPRFYPGSPRLAPREYREQERMELWEKHPDECAALREEFVGERRVSVHEADGYGAMRACVPPAERRAGSRGPPFEARGEWADVSRALGEGIGGFPGGTYVVWYPLTERANPDGFLGLLVAEGADPDSRARGRPRGRRGCGAAGSPWSILPLGYSTTRRARSLNISGGCSIGRAGWHRYRRRLVRAQVGQGIAEPARTSRGGGLNVGRIHLRGLSGDARNRRTRAGRGGRARNWGAYGVMVNISTQRQNKCAKFFKKMRMPGFPRRPRAATAAETEGPPAGEGGLGIRRRVPGGAPA